MDHYGLIEWEDGLTPTLIVGETWREIDRKAVAELQASTVDAIEDDNPDYNDFRDFLNEQPYPDSTDSDAVERWLNAMGESITIPHYTRMTERDVIVVASTP